MINNGDQFYAGIAFDGNFKNEQAKSHLVAGAGTSMLVPMYPGEKMIVTYYYTANFSIEGGEAIITESKSTSQFYTVSYVYTGSEEDYVTISFNSGTSYITNIAIYDMVAYSEMIYCDGDKKFQIINEAMKAIAVVCRANDDRDNNMVDPGNENEKFTCHRNNI